MADYSDYYSTIARAISGLPDKTEEARGAVYELARTALQKRLSAFDPPISETDLAIEHLRWKRPSREWKRSCDLATPDTA